MLTKRIIPCLDVKDGRVVKGVRFRDHKIMGDIVPMAMRYRDEGADEIVFYDITASSDGRAVSHEWISKVAFTLDIPFCVAGGITDVATAREILAAGADKISINSPALARPELITELAEEFGRQCIVVGIDSFFQDNDYYVYQYTGDPNKTCATSRRTFDWVIEAQQRGAGEIVLNCMNEDGVKNGYDIKQLNTVRQKLSIPVIASGGAGSAQHFADLFNQTDVDGALAASVFHSQQLEISALKEFLNQNNIRVRL